MYECQAQAETTVRQRRARMLWRHPKLPASRDSLIADSRAYGEVEPTTGPPLRPQGRPDYSI